MKRFTAFLTWCWILGFLGLASGTVDEPLANGTFDSDLTGWSLFPEPLSEEEYVSWDEGSSGALLLPYDNGADSPPDTNSVLSQEFLIPDNMALLSFDVVVNTYQPGFETDVLSVTIDGNLIYEFSSSQVNQAALDDDPLVTNKYIDGYGLVQMASYQTTVETIITQYAGENVELIFSLFNDNGDDCITHVVINNVELLADTTPPTVNVGGILELWPPNHKYHTFSLSDFVSCMDNVDGEIDPDLSGRILSIYSDEPEDINGNGDGSTTDDIVILNDCSFKVLAERQGSGNGRVYGITFEIADQQGNLTQATFTLGVPHDQSGDPPVDSGASAGYTVVNDP